MLSSELGDEHINGEFTATITGTITGMVMNATGGWTEVNVDVGLPGGSLVQLRLMDDDPIEVEATEVGQPFNPPQEPMRDRETGELIVDKTGAPVFPPIPDPEDTIS